MYADRVLAPFLRWMLALWVLLAGVPRVTFAAESRENLGPIRMRVLHGYPERTPVPGTRWAGGTAGVELTHTGSTPLQVQLGLDGEKRRITLAPGETRRVFLYTNHVDPYGHSLEVTASTGERAYRTLDAALLDPGAPSFATFGLGAWRWNLATGDERTAPDLRSWLPDSWRGLGAIDVIGASPQALLEDPADARVLRDWVFAGGVLLVEVPEGAASPRADVLAALLGNAPSSGETTLQLGLGSISFILGVSRPLALDLAHELGCQRAPGICDAHKPAAQDQAEGALTELRDDLSERHRASPRSAAEAGRAVQQRLHKLTLPRSDALLGILVVFVLAVGPLSWWWFVQRRSQPLAWVLSALGLSVLFSAIFLTMAVLEHGLNPFGAGATVKLIDHAADLEVDVSEGFVFAPTADGTRLHDGPEGAAIALEEVLCDMGYSRAADQCLDGGLGSTGSVSRLGEDCDACGPRVANDGISRHLPVRRAGWVRQRSVGPPSGRLVITESGHGLEVENHLGRDLSQLILWHRGLAWQTLDLRKGQRVTLAPLEPEEIPDLVSLIPRWLGPDVTHAARRLWEDAARDRYFARAAPQRRVLRTLTTPIDVLDQEGGLSQEDLWLAVGLLP